MRVDTPLGPVWLVSDQLPEKAAKKYAQLDLQWSELEGFVAMHTGSGDEGAWVVRAPREALEARGLLTTAAAELPVAEGTCWPPISDEGRRILEGVNHTMGKEQERTC